MQTLDLQNGIVAAAWRENIIGSLYEMAKRAPGQPLTLDFGARKVLLLQDAEHIRHVLRTKAGLYRKNLGGFQSLFGETRLTVDGSRWDFLQKLSQPHINAASITGVAESAQKAFSAAARTLLDAGTAQEPLAIDSWINRAAARVASDMVFGFHDFDIDQVLDDFRSVLRFGGARNWNFSGAIVETPSQRQVALDAKQRLAVVVERLIVEEAARNAETSLVRDIVMGEPLGADVVSEICTLLFAGFDTTATTVSWAMFLLAATPDLQRHLRAQVRASGFGQSARPEIAADIVDLVAFQNEVMRIFPPIPALGRLSIEADTIGDISVPPDQVVLISLIGLHHDARHFPAPAQVRLKRYVDGQLDRQLRGHLLPFGDGRRACGGSRVANIELTVAIATLIDQIEVNVAGSEPIKFDWTASLRRAGGQNLLIRAAPGTAN